VTHINNTSTYYVNNFGNFMGRIMMSCVMCVSKAAEVREQEGVT